MQNTLDNFFGMFYDWDKIPRNKGVEMMKQHRFWAWAALICMALAMLTGIKRK